MFLVSGWGSQVWGVGGGLGWGRAGGGGGGGVGLGVIEGFFFFPSCSVFALLSPLAEIGRGLVVLFFLAMEVTFICVKKKP
jgi:hypothetical protein